ncbi:hypothetical protein ACFLIM_42170 [Nonomuraea sp. M3C6]|uniref:Uncharacterized protein n=1 Tax=Nonomuraea marmarensis TaxID=3351344 RepID=A0ABW7AQW1_9ACTN
MIAYPDGHGGCWADGRGVTTAEEAGVDDVAFLRALIDHAADRYATAPDQTVVAGVSNGVCRRVKRRHPARVVGRVGWRTVTRRRRSPADVVARRLGRAGR